MDTPAADRREAAVRRALRQLPGRSGAIASHDHEPADPGVRENTRLTAVTGLVLLLPLLVVTGSGLVFGQLWRVHYFAGFLLLPLVLLKLASTGYRAARYYLGSARYRTAGPPAPALRLLAPVLVGSTALLFVSGVVMWIDHSRLQPWSTLHTDAAVVFCAAVAIHLLAYLPRAWRTARAARPAPEGSDPGRPARAAGRRRGAVAGAVVFGLVLAIATVPGSQAPQRGRDHPRGDTVVGTPPPPGIVLRAG
ncbi:MAG TPA: hypothetical protein VGL20_10160 [Candidatus Dormibacteraeota bacterium]|jgi:hypothetical protein